MIPQSLLAGLNLRFRLTSEPLDGNDMDKITDPAERARVTTVGARPENLTMRAHNRDTGELLAYAVLGRDDQGVLTIYAARSWLTGLGAMAMAGIFKGASAVDVPVRVHAEDEGRIAAYAKLFDMDLANAVPAVDADGVPMGVFHGK